MKRNIILSAIALFFCTSFVNAQTEEDKYAKKVLMEEFTTENCPNCPAVASLVAQLLNKEEYKGNIITVTHHSGYYTDWLTTEADENLLWFYASDYTYAPAMMFDRYPNFRDQYSNEQTPVGFVSNLYDMEKYVKRRLNKKAHVSIDIKAEYDNANTLKVYVQGDRTKVFSDTDPRIFVYVTENRIPADNQAGASGNYKHAHVMRAYNSIWGDKLTWDGDNYSYECTINVDSAWNQEEMHIVAFISAFDPTDPALCVVDNSRAIPFSATAGIEDAQMKSDVVSTEYFTLDGIRTQPQAHGIYVQKVTYSDGNIETKKVNR